MRSGGSHCVYHDRPHGCRSRVDCRRRRSPARSTCHPAAAPSQHDYCGHPDGGVVRRHDHRVGGDRPLGGRPAARSALAPPERSAGLAAAALARDRLSACVVPRGRSGHRDSPRASTGATSPTCRAPACSTPTCRRARSSAGSAWARSSSTPQARRIRRSTLAGSRTRDGAAHPRRTCSPGLRAMPSEHRLHPASILFALAGSLKAFALPALLLFFSSLRSSPSTARTGAESGRAGWFNRWMPGGIASWRTGRSGCCSCCIPATIAAVVRYLTFRMPLRRQRAGHPLGPAVPQRAARALRPHPEPRCHAHRDAPCCSVSPRCASKPAAGTEPEARISVLHETVFEEMRRRVFAGRARAGAGPGGDRRRATGDVGGGGAAPQAVADAAAPAGARAAAARAAREPRLPVHRRRVWRVLGEWAAGPVLGPA